MEKQNELKLVDWIIYYGLGAIIYKIIELISSIF